MLQYFSEHGFGTWGDEALLQQMMFLAVNAGQTDTGVFV